MGHGAQRQAARLRSGRGRVAGEEAAAKAFLVQVRHVPGLHLVVVEAVPAPRLAVAAPLLRASPSLVEGHCRLEWRGDNGLYSRKEKITITKILKKPT